VWVERRPFAVVAKVELEVAPCRPCNVEEISVRIGRVVERMLFRPAIAVMLVEPIGPANPVAQCE